MKKLLLVFIVILLSACSLMNSSMPKQKVSELLDRYKNQDETILSQLDETISSEYTNADYRDRYKTLMLNQYRDMEYKITDEMIEGDNAVVEVEITVYDYASAITNANDYLSSNPDKFATTKNNENTNSLNNYDEDKFTDYKITQMENVKDKVTYTLEFTLTKVNGTWQIDSMSNSDIEKIHGIYMQG